MQVTANDVDAFIRSTHFEGYQSVPLPFGRSVPGADRSRHADVALGDRVRGKTVLDVGTFYGFYPKEAVKRGAKRAVGVEPNASRFRIATRIAQLNGGHYEIVQGTAQDLLFEELFDVVLFLKVIHHVTDPISTMRHLAALTRELLIVEFRLPSHRPTIHRGLSPNNRTGSFGRAADRLQVSALSRLTRLMEQRLPIVMIDRRKTFYFSPKAFANLFVIHERLFERIEFTPSASPSCMIALCYR